MSEEFHLLAIISVGVTIFFISVIHNMITARFVEAPNTGFIISVIATLLTFTLLIIIIFILNIFNALFYNSYLNYFIIIYLAINVVIFSYVFNVDLINSSVMVVMGYFMTSIIILFFTLITLHYMGFNDYEEIMTAAEPYLSNLLKIVGYAKV